MVSTFALCSTDAPFIRITISPEVCTLSRASSCDVVLEHPTISRKHAELSASPTGLIVTDPSSRKGSYMEGHQIRHGLAAPGQTLQFGQLAFSVKGRDCEGEVRTNDLQDVPDSPSLTANTEVRLSGAQRMVLEFLIAGGSEKGIARQLELSRNTLHNHVTAIYRAFDVHSRAKLLAMFIQSGNKNAVGFKRQPSLRPCFQARWAGAAEPPTFEHFSVTRWLVPPCGGISNDICRG